MPLEPDQIKQLVNKPSESLGLELKQWIDINTNKAIAKIVKGLTALRNHNGGYLLIGFNNNDGSPDINSHPGNVKCKFHADVIQGMITKYSSEAFEVFVHYPLIGSKEYVVIEVPQGVETPVIIKKDLKDDDSTCLLKVNKIYVRTLNANNTVSTAEIKWNDWPSLVGKCFDNREANIGRFVRRHLSGFSDKKFINLIQNMFQNLEDNNHKDELINFLNESKNRFIQIKKERKYHLPEHGSMEFGVQVVGKINTYSADTTFLNLLLSSNPKYTGRPIWVDSRNFREDKKPFHMNGLWESFINSHDNGFLDFWRLSPNGKFYLYRALPDDISQPQNKQPAPLKELDYALVILKVAECILVSMEFAKAMSANDEDTTLQFVFRWNNLKDRNLSTWANPGRFLDFNYKSSQNTFQETLELPLLTAKSAIPKFLHIIVYKLFIIFDGYEINENTVQELFEKLTERRL